mmetsp:Transcript_20590/g.26635  ORF Transcript_20590/g.26635 Transcript_20590/m.26635 type:complete len:456 (+) Transcript_20590:347-1714(+)
MSTNTFTQASVEGKWRGISQQQQQQRIKDDNDSVGSCGMPLNSQNECGAIDRVHPVDGRFSVNVTKLGHALSCQPWSVIGQKAPIGSHPDCASVLEISTMMERVVAVLERRIVNLIRVERPLDSCKYLVQSSDGNFFQLQQPIHNNLTNYVGQIASMYRGVNYHSFMHATHVTLSIDKMIEMMLDEHNEECGGKRIDHCFGLYHDTMSQLCLVFTALVHDVDHTGVCNKDLVKGGSDLAIAYNNLSIAEQHSLAIAFSVLFEPDFDNLRDAMFATSEDYLNFMDVVTELIIHTDLGSPKIKESKNMWNKAFGEDLENALQCNNTNVADNRLKGLVMEVFIQAADVAHNIQSWENFILWNHRLYDELRHSYLQSMGDDPTPNWFRGQISFFDGYIIPLAKKLRQCGVFGKAGGMFLSCVLENRQRWIAEGERVTKMFINTRSFTIEKDEEFAMQTD